LASKKGWRTKILHMGLEWIERRNASPLGYLQDKEVKVTALPLHWNHQAYDVMRVAGEIKKARPEIFIVLGGYTASFFHREIMASFPQIDAIIRGDAETPLLTLMKAVNEQGGWEKIPNLTWRKGEETKENPLTYVAAEKDLDQASYANLSLLHDRETYVRFLGMPFVWAKGLTKEENRKRFHMGPSIFSLNIGRGCTGNCTWCGGGAEAQRLVNGRKDVVFRSPEAVVETVAEAMRAGYEIIHTAFDPGKEGDRYYQDLFPLLTKRGLRTKIYFESFSLPSEPFLDAFAEAFIREGSVIAISPESGDERIRHRNKTFSYTNEALMKTLSRIENLGVKVDLFFSMGIPGEKYSDLVTTASLKRKIMKRFKNIGRVWSAPIALEPASPWHLHPEEFGVISTTSSFADFYQKSSPQGKGFGYYIPDYMGNGMRLNEKDFDAVLKKAKCREFCSLHPDPAKASDPFWGRLYCHYRSWRSRGSCA